MTRSHDNARTGVNECQLGPTVSNDGNRLLGNKRRCAQRRLRSVAPSMLVVEERRDLARENEPEEASTTQTAHSGCEL